MGAVKQRRVYVESLGGGWGWEQELLGYMVNRRTALRVFDRSFPMIVRECRSWAVMNTG